LPLQIPYYRKSMFNNIKFISRKNLIEMALVSIHHSSIFTRGDIPLYFT
jgi:hypothetical protein